MRVRHLKFLYALAGLIWTGYWWEKLLSAHVADHVPISKGMLICLVLFVLIPAIGYGLLFTVFPWAARFRRR